MTNNKEDFIEHARRFCSDKYGEEISIDETKEIIHNLTEYFKLLIRLDKKK